MTTDRSNWLQIWRYILKTKDKNRNKYRLVTFPVITLSILTPSMHLSRRILLILQP